MNAADLALLLGDLMAAPSPSDGGEFNSVTVSPGLPGFFATFVLAGAVVLLVLDMSRRTRRVQAEARVQERMQAEEQAQRDGRIGDGSPDGADRTPDDLDGTPEDTDGTLLDDGRPGTDGGALGTDADGTDAEGPRPEDRR